MNDRTKMTGEWLAFCSSCPAPEIANIFNRTGIQFHKITSTLDEDDKCWKEVQA